MTIKPTVRPAPAPPVHMMPVPHRVCASGIGLYRHKKTPPSRLLSSRSSNRRAQYSIFYVHDSIESRNIVLLYFYWRFQPSNARNPHRMEFNTDLHRQLSAETGLRGFSLRLVDPLAFSRCLLGGLTIAIFTHVLFFIASPFPTEFICRNSSRTPASIAVAKESEKSSWNDCQCRPRDVHRFEHKRSDVDLRGWRRATLRGRKLVCRTARALAVQSIQRSLPTSVRGQT